MSGETIRLAEFASRLRLEDVPAPVIQRAKDAIADTIATIVFGRSLPWSDIIVAMRAAWATAAAAIFWATARER